jgi:hypothetical protein
MKPGRHQRLTVNSRRPLADRADRVGVRVQATLLVTIPPALEALRQSLDPAMAARIAPHVTAIYDDEAPEPALMLKRLSEICRTMRPLKVRLSRIVAFEAPSEGLYVDADMGVGFSDLRAYVLRPPFAPRGPLMYPHLTILHPRSAATCGLDWRSHIDAPVDCSTLVCEISVIELGGTAWNQRATIPFSGPP